MHSQLASFGPTYHLSRCSCPGAFVAAAAGVTIPAAGDTEARGAEAEESFLQLAPALGTTATILLGETTKFVPFSPKRFTGEKDAVSARKLDQPQAFRAVSHRDARANLHRSGQLASFGPTCIVRAN
jgi:hypothetical protein